MSGHFGVSALFLLVTSLADCIAKFVVRYHLPNSGTFRARLVSENIAVARPLVARFTDDFVRYTASPSISFWVSAETAKTFSRGRGVSPRMFEFPVSRNWNPRYRNRLKHSIPLLFLPKFSCAERILTVFP